MPANVKRSENLEKHQTKAEIQARQAAEAAILPDRAGCPKPPRTLNKDPAAKRYWKSILERMEGLAILDDLDGEMLAVYCAALSRRDSLHTLCRTLMAEMEQTEAPGERLELVNKLDTILSKLQAHEKILLSFADKLGMTPEARVRAGPEASGPGGPVGPGRRSVWRLRWLSESRTAYTILSASMPSK